VSAILLLFSGFFLELTPDSISFLIPIQLLFLISLVELVAAFIFSLFGKALYIMMIEIEKFHKLKC